MSELSVGEVVGMFALFFLLMAGYAFIVIMSEWVLTVIYFVFMGSVIAYTLLVELPRRKAMDDK